jgi:hypothetical protein
MSVMVMSIFTRSVERPRPLSASEARMMVELVDAWRALEHRKRMALKASRKDTKGT